MSFEDELSPMSLTLEESAPHRDRSYAECYDEANAKLIQDWLNAEEEKNGIHSPHAPEIKETRIFKKGSPSETAVDKANELALARLDLLRGLRSPFSPATTEESLQGSAASSSAATDKELCQAGTGKDPSCEIEKIQEILSHAAGEMTFSPITNPTAIATRNVAEKRPVLAHISSAKGVDFVPDSWLTLYQDRPYEDDDDKVKLAWLEKVVWHLREPSEEQSVVAPLDESINVLSNTSALYSPLSMPSGIQTQRRNQASLRSILKNPSGDNTLGSSGMRGRLAVRFEHPATSIKRPSKQLSSPTTWPPDAPVSKIAAISKENLFKDIWKHQGARVTSGKENMIPEALKPYQTPESTSTKSSNGDNEQFSSESMTTVMISGKENKPLSTSFKSQGEGKAHKNLSSRMPLQGKKLDYERSSSERNIINGMA